MIILMYLNFQNKSTKVLENIKANTKNIYNQLALVVNCLEFPKYGF